MTREPKCNHVNQTVRISSHVDLAFAQTHGMPHASTYACERPGCQEDAKRWVRETIPRSVPVTIPLYK